MFRLSLLLTACAMLGCCLALPLGAQPPPNPPPAPPVTAAGMQNILGMSDVAVLATITNVVMPPPPEVIQIPGALSTNPLGSQRSGPSYAQVTLRIDKSLIGNLKPGDTVTIPIQCNVRFDRGPQPVFKGWSPDLKPNTQRLLALQRGQTAYTLGGYQSDAAVGLPEDLPKWEEALATMPFQITFSPVQGIITFGGATQVTLTLKNLSDTPATVINVVLGGYYLSTKLDPYLPLAIVQPPKGMTADTPPAFNAPLALAAKTEKTLTFFVSANSPPAWALIDPASYLITPVALRATATVRFDVNGGRPFISPLCPAYVGFPQPKLN